MKRLVILFLVVMFSLTGCVIKQECTSEPTVTTVAETLPEEPQSIYEERDANLGKNITIVMKDAYVVNNWDDSKKFLVITIEFSHSFCCERSFMRVVNCSVSQGEERCPIAISYLMKYEDRVDVNTTEKIEPTQIQTLHLLYELVSEDMVNITFTHWNDYGYKYSLNFVYDVATDVTTG